MPTNRQLLLCRFLVLSQELDIQEFHKMTMLPHLGRYSLYLNQSLLFLHSHRHQLKRFRALNYILTKLTLCRQRSSYEDNQVRAECLMRRIKQYVLGSLLSSKDKRRVLRQDSNAEPCKVSRSFRKNRIILQRMDDYSFLLEFITLPLYVLPIFIWKALLSLKPSSQRVFRCFLNPHLTIIQGILFHKNLFRVLLFNENLH